MFGEHFKKERLQYGLYGLYPKYRVYVEPLTVFQGMIGHALVVATLQNDRGTLSDKRTLTISHVLCVVNKLNLSLSLGSLEPVRNV